MSKVSDKELTGEISIYARISVDIEKESDHNTSIENQLKIMRNYVLTHFPKCTIKEYIDRDRSGYTFAERENYMTMREALIGGQSKILIVKDLSRFSRRNGHGLVELETLRDNDVRLIAIMDNIDYPTNIDDWQQIQFRFLINETPVTDTSRKVKNSISNMQQQGSWICAVPYGYRLVDFKKGIIETVADEVEVVKEIFKLYAFEGMGYKKIANYLTEKGIPTPRMKERERAEAEGKVYKRQAKKEWSHITVEGILHNDYYIGTFRGHKYTRKSINGKDVKLDADEQIVIQKHHKAIIDEKTFLFTQDELEKRTTSHYRGVKKYDTPYTSVLFCGDCQSPMFSMSRSDLAPAYTCGTYHKRGLNGCTSHHTRVDFLDTVLKDYIKIVKDNCQDMIKELQQAVTLEENAVKTSDKLIMLFEKQIADAKLELKATTKTKVKEIMNRPHDEDMILETYGEIEEEIRERIANYEAQHREAIAKRGNIVEVARVSRTVFDVFEEILTKDKLSKMDIALIVDKIFVYENGDVDIHLKSDIDQLLQTGKLPGHEEIANFNFDSIGNSFTAQYSHKAKNQREKAYTVNVVSEGDPLEIYTDKDGEVIFKKYSPVGELASFAVHICETLYKTTGATALVCDRDTVIAVSGPAKRELLDKRISESLEHIIESRQIYQHKSGESTVHITDPASGYYLSIAAPIISEGDVSGCVVFAFDGSEAELGETGYKLAQTVAGFLGKQMES